MSSRYVRDPRSGVLILGDRSQISSMKEKKTLKAELELMKGDINTLKREIDHLKSLLSPPSKSE